MATAMGPERWKDTSIGGIKVAQTLTDRAERDVYDARRTDPLPSLRDSCVQESNRRIHSYARATRAVVVHLRQVLVATNEEIKSLNRTREALERSLDHCRKDIALNVQCIKTRNERPKREKSPSDGADDLLTTERSHLLQQKLQLEAKLKLVLQQLQILSGARSALTSAIQERSRVTELLCHSISSTYHYDQTKIITRRHLKCSSAPPIMLCGQLPETFTVGPFDPLTPAAYEAVKRAKEACQKSSQLRNETLLHIDQLQQHQRDIHQLVNDGLTQKIAETVTLSEHLHVNSGETKNVINKTSRHLKLQEKSLGYLQGPEASTDITKREKLDRPLVRVYQQHPGTDLPEASHLIQASNMYMDSISQTQRNLSLLKLARKKLKEDIHDKKVAIELDSNLVRLRRRKADHRWVLQGNAVTLLQHPDVSSKVQEN